MQAHISVCINEMYSGMHKLMQLRELLLDLEAWNGRWRRGYLL